MQFPGYIMPWDAILDCLRHFCLLRDLCHYTLLVPMEFRLFRWRFIGWHYYFLFKCKLCAIEFWVYAFYFLFYFSEVESVLDVLRAIIKITVGKHFAVRLSRCGVVPWWIEDIWLFQRVGKLTHACRGASCKCSFNYACSIYACFCFLFCAVRPKFRLSCAVYLILFHCVLFLFCFKSSYLNLTMALEWMWSRQGSHQSDACQSRSYWLYFLFTCLLF